MSPSDALMDHAREALASARFLIDGEHVRAAVNRAYYATFYAASAAIASEREAPRSHKGVRTLFLDLFVRTGRFDADLGRILAYAEQRRNRADYDAFSVFDANATRDLIGDAERFVAAVESMLNEPRGPVRPSADR